MFSFALLASDGGGLSSLAVAYWTTNYYHPCSNLGMGISEGCFISDLASLPLKVAGPNHHHHHQHLAFDANSDIILEKVKI